LQVHLVWVFLMQVKQYLLFLFLTVSYLTYTGC
jgi:hypothetical protein